MLLVFIGDLVNRRVIHDDGSLRLQRVQVVDRDHHLPLLLLRKGLQIAELPEWHFWVSGQGLAGLLVVPIRCLHL